MLKSSKPVQKIEYDISFAYIYFWYNAFNLISIKNIDNFTDPIYTIDIIITDYHFMDKDTFPF